MKKSDQAELERLAKERRKKEVNLNRMSGGGISSGGGTISSGGRGIKNEVTCNKCGEKGHMMRTCPQGSGQPDVECFRCGKKGHLKMDCPNARQESSQGQGKREGASRPWKRRSGAGMDLDY